MIRIIRLFIEKLFSRQDGLRNLSINSDKVCIGIIKLVELYDHDNGENIKHWMNSITSAIANVVNSENKISSNFISPQTSFIKAVENKFIISKILGNDFIKYCSFGVGEEYIENLWKEILNMTLRGEKKYVDAIKNNGGFLVSPKDYIILFKYISLCLTEQLDYRNIDFWSDLNLITREKTDYLIDKDYQDFELKQIIANCIFQFKGNVPDPGNNILKFL